MMFTLLGTLNSLSANFNPFRWGHFSLSSADCGKISSSFDAVNASIDSVTLSSIVDCNWSFIFAFVGITPPKKSIFNWLGFPCNLSVCTKSVDIKLICDPESHSTSTATLLPCWSLIYATIVARSAMLLFDCYACVLSVLRSPLAGKQIRITIDCAWRCMPCMVVTSICLDSNPVSSHFCKPWEFSPFGGEPVCPLPETVDNWTIGAPICIANRILEPSLGSPTVVLMRLIELPMTLAIDCCVMTHSSHLKMFVDSDAMIVM